MADRYFYQAFDHGCLLFNCGGNFDRYLAGSRRKGAIQPLQQTNTMRPSTSTRTGPPIESKGSPVTGQIFCLAISNRSSSAMDEGGVGAGAAGANVVVSRAAPK